MDRAHVGRVFVMGLACFGNVVGSMLALELLSPKAFGMVQPSVPVIAMAMSYFTGMELMSGLKCMGIVVCVLGAVAAEFSNSTTDPLSGGRVGAEGASEAWGEEKGGLDARVWLGNLVLLWQCCSMAVLVVAQKPMLSAYPPATVTAWYYAVGSLFTLAMCPLLGVKLEDFLLTQRIEPWIALVYVVVVGTVYPYNAYSWAVSMVAPSTVVVYVTLQPVFTITLSMIFLGTVMRFEEMMAGLV
ncbi:unnamed protein product, partial [Discosporangium mesarthrocarpum]